MEALLGVLQNAVWIGFLLLAILTGVDWVRNPSRSRAWLALAVGSLALCAALSALRPLPEPWAGVASESGLITFLFSGYALVVFRSTFIPTSRRALVWVGAGTAAALVLGTGLTLLVPRDSPALTTLPLVLAIAIILFWCGCVGEPAVRFWLVARACTAVQRARLRAMSAGYAGLVVALVTAIVAALLVQGSGRGPALQSGLTVALQVAVLATVPFLYASFSPPAWLRRLWRAPEEHALRDAMGELLLFSSSRAGMAEMGLEWAIRLLGADAGLIVDGEGTILARRGLDDTLTQEILQRLGGPGSKPGGMVTQLPAGPDEVSTTAVALTLQLNERGPGLLVILAGPLSPLFGSDELSLVSTYATSLTAGLDRVTVTEQLAGVEHTKSEFLNLASHELRGPISVLRGYLSMLIDGSVDDPDQVAHAYSIMAGKAAEMNRLVEQMLEVARLEEGQLEVRATRADLVELTNQAVENARPLGDLRHPIRVESTEAVLPVMVDRRLIITIINNLLSNAIKYSPRGGDVECQVARDRDLAKVTVTDHGVGISTSDLDRLFSRFGRIVTPDTAAIGGTGLGLYLSRELARMHGGDLTVESAPGRGSTFVLAVPISPPGRSLAPRRSPAASGRRLS